MSLHSKVWFSGVFNAKLGIVCCLYIPKCGCSLGYLMWSQELYVGSQVATASVASIKNIWKYLALPCWYLPLAGLGITAFGAWKMRIGYITERRCTVWNVLETLYLQVQFHVLVFVFRCMDQKNILLPCPLSCLKLTLMTEVIFPQISHFMPSGNIAICSMLSWGSVQKGKMTQVNILWCFPLDWGLVLVFINRLQDSWESVKQN